MGLRRGYPKLNKEFNSGSLNNPEDLAKKQGYISLAQASELFSISRAYLNVLIHRGKIKGKKFGRNWYTTKESVEHYIKTTRKAPVSPTPSLDLEKEKRLIEEAVKQQQKTVEEKLDKKFIEEKNFFQALVDKLSSIDKKADSFVLHAKQPHETLDPEERDFLKIGSESITYKLKKFNKEATQRTATKRGGFFITIAAVVILFLIVGGISFGNIDPVVTGIKNVFKDATTLQGHWPGTHANEVLLLDKNGNISIYGHIETRGQLRSWVKDGIAPIVVDSTTMVENLNAEMVGGMKAQEFTLAFVTKNGNITTEDVYLEGNVEVGKTLLVKGATKLLDSLLVDGSLGVGQFGASSVVAYSRFGEATTSYDLSSADDVLISGKLEVDGNAWFDSNATISGDLYISGNLVGASISQAAGWQDDGTVVRLITPTDKVGIGTTTPEAKLHTAGSGRFDNELIIGETLQVGSTTSTSYSRFGANTTGHSLSGASDLLISGSLEVDGDTWLDNNVSISGNLDITGDLNVTNIQLETASVSGDFEVGGQILASDGTSSAPSYAFKQDKDTGIYRINNNVIGITTGGTERFRISETGASLSLPFEVGSDKFKVAASTGNTDIAGNLTVSGTGTHSFAGTLDPNQVTSFTLTGTQSLGTGGYYLNNTGDAYLRYLGIGTAPDSNYPLKLSGNAYFQDITYLGTTNTYFDTSEKLDVSGLGS